MRRRPFLVLAVAALAAGCGELGSSAPSVTMPSRASHGERFFPITTSTAHGDASCDDCHGTFDTFRKFDCITCHAGTPADATALTAVHASQAGFPDLAAPDRSVPSAGCLLCHSDGTADGIDPAVHGQKYFPIGAGTAHAGASCGDCHTNPTAKADVSTLGCAGCHDHEQAAMATAHARVKANATTGYAFSSAMCVRCHAEGQVDAVTAHTPFVITSGNHGPTEDGLCLRCHPGLRTDRPWAADFGVKDCLGCHQKAETDAEHAGRANYAYTTAKCLDCHPDGRE